MSEALVLPIGEYLIAGFTGQPFHKLRLLADTSEPRDGLSAMRLVASLLLIVLCTAGCGRSPNTGTTNTSQVPAYSPETFRADIERLVGDRDYSAAVGLLAAADVAQQVKYDEAGYIAVAEDMILLPGVYPKIEFDRDRDWQFPGTSDALENVAWQNAATDFAFRYNQLRAGG